MNDLQALLAATIADPADDAPRLIFADALEEECHHGQFAAWAAFIRWQVAGFRREEPYITCDYIPEQLMGTGCEAGPVCYNQEFSDWFHGHAVEVVGDRRSWTWTWRRGFVDELIMPGDDAVDHVDKLKDVHPLSKVVVTSRPSQVHRDALSNRWPVEVGDLTEPYPLYYIRAGGIVRVVDPSEAWKEQLRLLAPGVEFLWWVPGEMRVSALSTSGAVAAAAERAGREIAERIEEMTIGTAVYPPRRRRRRRP